MDNLTAQLVIRQQGDELLIDARLLHQELEIVTRFSDWITRRLADALAVEGQDFYSTLSRSQANRQTTEYALTLDLAKQLAMLERSERGREVRLYFIQAEKQMRGQLTAPAPLALPSYPEALRQLADTVEANARLEAENAALVPKAQGFDALINADGTYSVAEAAKLLGTGEIRLYRLLRDRKILQDQNRSGPEHHNVPYQQYLDAGYFTLITRPRPTIEGKPDRLSYTTRVTTKGLAWMQKNLATLGLVNPPPASFQRASA